MSKFKERLKSFAKSDRLSSGVITAIVILIAIALNIAVYAIGFNIYTEVERSDLTISNNTDSLFPEDRIKHKKVTVTFCQAYDDIISDADGLLGWILNTADQFAERYPDFIEVRFANIYTQQLVGRNDSSVIEGVDLNRYIETDEDGNKSKLYVNSIIFDSGIDWKVVNEYDFFTLDSSGNPMAYNGEEVFASMTSWVLEEEHKTAYFTTFHGETADVGFRTMLICAGYNIGTINLRNNEIPEDAGLIVISSPKSDFERAQAGSGIRTEIERLTSYVKRGGDVYVSLDPYASDLPVLEEFLAYYGVEISTTERKEEGKIYKNLVRDPDSGITSDYFTLVADIPAGDSSSVAEAVKKYSGDKKVIISNVAALNLSGGATPLLKASSGAELYAGGESVDGKGGYTVGAIANATDDMGKEAGRIVVIPSIYLTATDTLVSGGYANRDFLYAVMEHIYGVSTVPYGCNSVFISSSVLENLTMRTARIFTAIILMVPVAVAVVGAVIIIRRKNR